uniref:Uncharacterized protein n=1 Tax=Odontella aurita TaxID=265563 RepID=A0A7S4J804_9STRA
MHSGDEEEVVAEARRMVAHSPARRFRPVSREACLSPRQSPKPERSFNETVISDADSAAQDGGNAEHEVAEGVSISFLNGIPTLDENGRDPAEAMEAMEARADAEEVARQQLQIQGVGLETSCTDADGSIWAMCGTYSTRPALSKKQPARAAKKVARGAGAAVVGVENDESTADVALDADVSAPNPQSSSNDSCVTADSDPEVYAADGGVMKEPGEMLSFLGESFLDDTLAGSVTGGIASASAAERKRGGFLSPLVEADRSADEAACERSADRTDSEEEKAPQSRGDVRVGPGKMISFAEDVNGNRGNGTDEDSALLVPPPSSARSARSARSIGTFSLPEVERDCGSDAATVDEEGNDEGFPSWTDNEGDDEFGECKNEVNVSVAISVVSDDDDEDQCNAETGHHSQRYPDNHAEGGKKLGGARSIKPRVNFNLPNDDEADDNGSESDSQQMLAPLSTSEVQRNMMDAALQETEGYEEAIEVLRSELDVAEAKTVQERRRRKEAEERIRRLEERVRSVERGSDDNDVVATASPGTALIDTPKSVSTRSATTPASIISKRVDSTTADLIERNKTLVKEVRFADQTCVELSERSASLQSEVDRLSNDLEERDDEVAHLRADLLKAGRDGARMEQQRDTALERTQEVKTEGECRLKKAHEKLAESQRREEELNARILEGAKALAAAEARVEVMRIERDSAEETASQLCEREAEDERCDVEMGALRERVETLRGQRDELLEKVGMESAEKDRAIQECDGLREWCSELEEQLIEAEELIATAEEAATAAAAVEEQWTLDVEEEEKSAVPGTPQVAHRLESSSVADERRNDNLRTPTSNVLAKTLRSELRRGREDRDRLDGVERDLADAETRLHMALVEADGLREELADREYQLEEREKELDALVTSRSVNSSGEELEEGTDCSGANSVHASTRGSGALMEETDAEASAGSYEETCSASDGSEDTEETSQHLDILVEEMERLRSEASERQDELEGARRRVALVESELEDARTRMLRALHDREALQAEVGALRDSLDDAKDVNTIVNAEAKANDARAATEARKTVLAAVSQINYACSKVGDEAEKKLRDQARTVTRLTEAVRYLQSQLDFQEEQSQSQNTANMRSEDLSGIRSASCDESCAEQSIVSDVSGDGGNYDGNIFAPRAHATHHNDNNNGDDDVINATFASGCATRDSRTYASEQNTLELMEEARFHESELREELRSTTERLAEADAKRQELFSDLKKARAEVQEQRDTIMILKAQYTYEKGDLVEKISKAQTKVEELDAKLAEAARDLDDARECHAREAEMLNAHLDDLRTQLEDCQDQVDDSAQEADMLREDKAELAAQIGRFETKVARAQRDHAQVAETLSNEVEAHAQERREFQDEIEALQTNLGVCENRLEAAKDEGNKVRREADERIYDLSMKKEALEEEGRRLRERAEQRQAELERERTQALNAREEAEKERRARADAEGEVEKSRAAANVLRSKIEVLAGAAEVTRSELEACQSALQDAKDAAAALEKEKTNLKEDITSAMSTLHRIEYDRASLNSDLKDLEEAKEKAECSLHAEIEEKARRISEVEEELSSRSEEMDKLNEELSQVRQESDDHLNRCLDLEDEIDRNKATAEKDEVEIEELKEALQTCSSEMETLKTSYVSCNDKLAEAMERNRADDRCIEEMKTSASATEEKLRAVASCLSEAKRELMTMQQQRDDLKRITDNMDREADRLRSELEATSAGSRANMEEKERALEELAESKRVRVSDLEGRLSVVTEERDQAVEALGEATAKFRRDLADIVAATNLAVAQCGVDLDSGTLEATDASLFDSPSSLPSLSQSPSSLNRSSPNVAGSPSSLDKSWGQGQEGLSMVLNEVRYCHSGLKAMIAKVSEQADLLQGATIERQRLASEVTTHYRSKEELRVSLADEKEKSNKLESKLKSAYKRADSNKSKLVATESALHKSKKSMEVVERELESTLRDFDGMKKMSDETNEEREEMERTLRRTVRERDEAAEERDDALDRLKEARDRLKEKEGSVESLVRQREDTSNDLWKTRESASKAEEELLERTEELVELREKHDSLDRKCVRLRDYIKKLTGKCEEWSTHYEESSKQSTDTMRAHQAARDRIAELERELAAARSCSECKALGRAVSTEEGKREVLREQISERKRQQQRARTAREASGGKARTGGPTNTGKKTKVVSWNATPSDKKRTPSGYPKTPLRSLDSNSMNLNNRRGLTTPASASNASGVSVDL